MKKRRTSFFRRTRFISGVSPPLLSVSTIESLEEAKYPSLCFFDDPVVLYLVAEEGPRRTWSFAISTALSDILKGSGTSLDRTFDLACFAEDDFLS
jgi:hypothetical protein